MLILPSARRPNESLEPFLSGMNGGDLYELAKILGRANIKMTERYAKLGRRHIAMTDNTAREL